MCLYNVANANTNRYGFRFNGDKSGLPMDPPNLSFLHVLNLNFHIMSLNIIYLNIRHVGEFITRFDPYTVVTRNMAFPRSMLPSREAPSRRRREDSSDHLDLAEKSLAMAQLTRVGLFECEESKRYEYRMV